MTPEKSESTPETEEKAILVVDDHPLLRRGLAALITGEPGLWVCGEASTCQGAFQAIEKHRPDLAIVDLGLEAGDGMDLVKDLKIRHPEIPALVLSLNDESIYAERAIKAGARGYLSKQQLDDTVLIAIRRVLGGEIFLSEKMTARFAQKFLGGFDLKENSPLSALTDRQLEVFRLIGRGYGTREIAERLTLSIKTIESHRENLKQKLTIKSSAALVQSATRWVDTGEVS